MPRRQNLKPLVTERPPRTESEGSGTASEADDCEAGAGAGPQRGSRPAAPELHNRWRRLRRPRYSPGGVEGQIREPWPTQSHNLLKNACTRWSSPIRNISRRTHSIRRSTREDDPTVKKSRRVDPGFQLGEDTSGVYRDAACYRREASQIRPFWQLAWWRCTRYLGCVEKLPAVPTLHFQAGRTTSCSGQRRRKKAVFRVPKEGMRGRGARSMETPLNARRLASTGSRRTRKKVPANPGDAREFFADDNSRSHPAGPCTWMTFAISPRPLSRTAASQARSTGVDGAGIASCADVFALAKGETGHDALNQAGRAMWSAWSRSPAAESCGGFLATLPDYSRSVLRIYLQQMQRTWMKALKKLPDFSWNDEPQRSAG